MGEYIKENIQAGRGINYKNFGAFAFEVNTDLVKPAQLSNFDITKDLDNQREERKHNHKIRPCFVPDKKFQDVNICVSEFDKDTFKTEAQARSALAYAQITQLMALPCYNGDWTPNWDDPNQEKYCITRMKYDIVKLDYSGYFSFLAFKSEKVRDEFYHNHMNLIKQFYELCQPVKS